MTRLYITRHGQTKWNIENRMQGWKDSELTKLGMKQARWLSERLENIDFQAIYSSPLNRALDTAKIICSNRDIEVKVNENLKEMSFGNWEGKTSDEIKSKYSKEYQNFWKNPNLFEGDSGETFVDVRNRVLPLIKDLILNYNGDLLIVTHTVVIKVLMSYFEKREIKDLWEPPFIHQTCLNLIEIDNNSIEIVLYGDTSHYKEENL